MVDKDEHMNGRSGKTFALHTNRARCANGALHMNSFRVAAFVIVVMWPAFAAASGHGPVFAAATPTLGRGGWGLDQAWTIRVSDADEHQQMLKTMLSFGITENLQLSASLPVAMNNGDVGPARMMSMMSSEREFEGLLGYRFQRRALGVGTRQESTVYVGGTVPLQTRRGGMLASRSIEIGAATGYASRAHYVWIGGGVQHFFERDGDRFGQSRLLTAVYGYRPPPLRTEAGKPDLRFFVEATAEDRAPMRTRGVDVGRGARAVFAGPTALLLHKAIGIEGGVLFPVYQRADSGFAKESVRVAVDLSYFFWLK
jgi:hypothetical protein